MDGHHFRLTRAMVGGTIELSNPSNYSGVGLYNNSTDTLLVVWIWEQTVSSPLQAAFVLGLPAGATVGTAGPLVPGSARRGGQPFVVDAAALAPNPFYAADQGDFAFENNPFPMLAIPPNTSLLVQSTVSGNATDMNRAVWECLYPEEFYGFDQR